MGRQNGGELDLVHDGPPAGKGPAIRFHEEAESYPLKVRHLTTFNISLIANISEKAKIIDIAYIFYNTNIIISILAQLPILVK